jgi:hypothetical protein
MEIIDAWIPQTQYAIHAQNNRVVLMINNQDEESFESSYDINIPPGDYTITEFIEAFNEIATTFEQPIQMHIIPIRFQVVFRSILPFHVNLRESTSTTVLGFDKESGLKDSVASVQNLDQFEYINIQDTTNEDDQFIESDPFKVYEHTFSVMNPDTINLPEVYHLKEVIIPDMKLILEKNIIPVIQFKLNILDNKRDVIGELETVRDSVFRFTNDVALYPNNNYTICISFTHVERYDISKIQIPVHSNINYPSMIRNHGMTLTSQEDPMFQPHFLNDKYSSFYGIRIRILVEKRMYSIIPMGKYNLFPDSCAVLRCKEMEPHFPNGVVRWRNDVPSSFMFGTVVRLCDPSTTDNPSCIPQQSVNKHPMQLTPIHRLSRMSFVLENIDGSLYDCKGYNHSFTIRLHYMNVKSNINQYTFQEQTVFQQVEALNEREEAYFVS